MRKRLQHRRLVARLLETPDTVARSEGIGEVELWRTPGDHAAHRGAHVGAGAVGEQHRPGLRAQGLDVRRARLLHSGARLLVAAYDAAQVLVDVAASDDPGEGASLGRVDAIDVQAGALVGHELAIREAARKLAPLAGARAVWPIDARFVPLVLCGRREREVLVGQRHERWRGDGGWSQACKGEEFHAAQYTDSRRVGKHHSMTERPHAAGEEARNA